MEFIDNTKMYKFAPFDKLIILFTDKIFKSDVEPLNQQLTQMTEIQDFEIN